MQNRRKDERLDLNKGGRVRFQDTENSPLIDCLVRDISDSGARLIAFTALKFPAEFELRVNDLEKKACQVRWRLPGQLGVEFVSSTPI